ncbi:exosome complex component RRP45 [Danio rerio]|uniref:Exosome complex component RRP45 n=1 Tax=Danio rerio TaxID=7955 RepID=EXOS9_DANRE|nr:exosome complex component RRP45 [Danio rerio]Q5XJQ5.1 RecName: Full=Exosome complex component RRP45; AltName: Full=Exosome component 9 [Danio rerio]AAH83243.1 Exosome component 9 [Danio rerio]AAI64713.1 Exosc9 protein [Danio rerio]|eukprot:NP_001006077.1 exosome complex component RRP45 [Danio rerio]
MRDTPLSNCERLFLLKAIKEKKRLDGRQTYDYRNIKISFGTDYGCCVVELGKTRVLSQVSCELVPPKDSRPTEGIVFFNLELSPMASPAFEPNRQSELLVTLNRQLERCLRNSKCIDTESLCVVSGEKVWQIRVDVHVLNHDGNLMDAASIAAISALSHFRRPDVAIQGRDVTVFGPEERDPIPLSIYHMPICVSFAFFLQGSFLLVDPCEREERVKDGLLVIAMNKHREICSIQSSGGIMLLKEQVLRCSKIASVKVSEITELINKALENDKKVRKEGGKFGFAESMPKERITTLKRDEAPVEMTDVKETADDIVQRTETTTETVPSPILVATGTAQIGEGIVNSWGLDEDEDDELQTEDRKTDEVVVITDSEEEEVVILNDQKSKKTSKQK